MPVRLGPTAPRTQTQQLTQTQNPQLRLTNVATEPLYHII